MFKENWSIWHAANSKTAVLERLDDQVLSRHHHLAPTRLPACIQLRELKKMFGWLVEFRTGHSFFFGTDFFLSGYIFSNGLLKHICLSYMSDP